MTKTAEREGFSSRRVFILAAIGSAVGLGNIWRFPYVAYENGGGAFVIPYLVALLVAGIPYLMFDYAIGHRGRGSAPLSFARIHRRLETIGWWQVLVCVIIAVYYAAILAWAARYTIFSATEEWGDNPAAFFSSTFLQSTSDGVSTDFVAGLTTPLVLVWVVIIGILALGVQKGVGATSAVLIPVLIVTFGLLVVRSLFLDGSGTGLDALFSPNWEALKHTEVWAAAFGQIFFSLSVGFGIMITYASYVKRKTNMTGSALVVGFSNSGFEILAGIGVFSALGFLAQAQAVPVDEVAEGGIGLAFIAFPTIISEAPGGSIIGILFFGSLVFAAITSLISVIEVVIAAVREKFDLSRIAATALVTVPMAVGSTFLFGTTSSLAVLDIVDHFVNQFGILFAALIALIAVGVTLQKLPVLANYLNTHGSLRLGLGWITVIGGIVPIILGYSLLNQFQTDLDGNYGGGDYPAWMVITFGWAMVAALPLLAGLIAALPWRHDTSLEVPSESTDDELEEATR